MGNEGKLFLAVSAEGAAKALQLLKSCKYGENSAILGEAQEGAGVYLLTELGSYRKLLPLQGEGLPRIC